MKKRTNLIVACTSLFAGVSLLVGSTLAAWLVEDDANLKGVKIGLREISSVIVNFMNPNGTLFKQYNVTSGSSIGEDPGAPSISGDYVFDGWSTDDATLVKTNDNVATRTYTTGVTYYPRFASYGYKIGSNAVQPLANKWDVNNNISIPQNGSLVLGTYVYGKSSLENATSSVTIPNAGSYALVCGEHDEDWDPSNSTKSATLSNWHIEKYYEYTITNNMKYNGYGLFAHFYDNNDVGDDRIMNDNLISGNTYFVYSKYTNTKVIFGALRSGQTTLGNNWENVIKQFDSITLDNSYQYSAPATQKQSDKYFRGTNNGWDTSMQMDQSFDSNNQCEILHVSLSQNDEFKIASANWGDSWGWTWDRVQGSAKNYFNQGSGDNIKCNTTGVYNFYLGTDHHIYVVKV